MSIMSHLRDLEGMSHFEILVEHLSLIEIFPYLLGHIHEPHHYTPKKHLWYS